MNKDETKEYMRVYYKNNKERMKELNQIWKDNNAEHLKEYRREYYREYNRKKRERKKHVDKILAINMCLVEAFLNKDYDEVNLFRAELVKSINEALGG